MHHLPSRTFSALAPVLFPALFLALFFAFALFLSAPAAWASDCETGFAPVLPVAAAKAACQEFRTARKLQATDKTACGKAVDAAQAILDPELLNARYSCAGLEDYRQIMPCVHAMKPLRYETYLRLLTLRAHCESSSPESGKMFRD